jgi:cytochrome c oxidase cbb3-type subunit IV
MTWHSTYDFLRHLADSWGLVAIALMWLTFAAWPFRPSARASNKRAANMIFEDQTHGE